MKEATTLHTVEKTVKLDLCVSCSICQETCPQNAIKLEFASGQYIPVINEGKCNFCGVCLKVCPGIEVDYKDLYNYESRVVPNNVFVGHVMECYTAYTTNETTHVNSSSGGVITSLVTDLLPNGICKGAFVLPWSNPNDGLAKLIYTNSQEDIIQASRSKYLPVSVEEVIKLCKEKDALIIVGTPCQIHGIKRYMKLYGIDSSNYLFLGLFCEKTLNYNLLQFFEIKYGKGRKIKEFYYRHKGKDGWPGHTKIVFDNGEEQFVDRRIRMRLKSFFQLNRCLFCIDKLNQFADISFGDCYIKGEEDRLGKSSVIVRTEKGREAFDQASNCLNIKKVSVSDLAESQNIDKKREGLCNDDILKKKHNHYINHLGSQYTGDIIVTEKQEDLFRRNQAMIELGKQGQFKTIDFQLNKIRVKNNFMKCVKYLAKKFGIKK